MMNRCIIKREDFFFAQPLIVEGQLMHVGSLWCELWLSEAEIASFKAAGIATDTRL